MLVDVDTDEHGEPIDDDGCGDGRGVIAIFEGREQRSKSLNRPKDFGGAMVMVSSALIGLGRATGESLAQVSASAVNLLKRRRIGFGGHTDPKVHDEHGTGSGCGAIDKAPDHVKTVVEHADYIKAGLAACGVDTTSAVVADTLSNYTDYYQAEVAGKEDQYSGKAVLTANLTEEGKIVKELEPKHREVAVIFNDIEGKTVNQALIREITDNAAQVFAVDVWRLRSIANRAFDDPKEQEQAFVSMLVHTLAVAHVLTAGDLPVYQFTQTPELAAA